MIFLEVDFCKLVASSRAATDIAVIATRFSQQMYAEKCVLSVHNLI